MTDGIRTMTALLAVLMLAACAKKEEAAPAPEAAPAAEVAAPAADPAAPPADASAPATEPGTPPDQDDGSQSGGDKVKPGN
jgi:uncharacterized lipoprotein YbaY